MPSPADLPSWIFGYALLFGLVHLVVLYYLYRATAGTSLASSARTGADDVAVGDETVTCANCGAENELGYRYCRNCVAELSGGVDRANAENAPDSRGIL